ncbi:MAG: hypothetical protein R6V55_06295, partial [Desulfovermiculus sp.]
WTPITVSICEAIAPLFAVVETVEISVLPLHLPPDAQALEGISEFARKGNPNITDHTLKNVDAFRQWEEEVVR